jgi:SPOR domain
MADSGVARDRLPWLEPYRAPPRKTSNRRAGVAATIGAIGLAGVVTLLTRDMIPFPAADRPTSEDSVTLPAPADMQPQIVLPPLEAQAEPAVQTASVAPAPHRPVRIARRRITAVPTRAEYRQVVRQQAEQDAAEPAVSQNAVAIAAIAALPMVAEPPRPAVNPAARVVRGKTVQLGVYRTAGQAEAAWRSAVRDYTYLVTMPKSIEAISLRSKRYYRLQLGTPSKQHARQLCGNLKSIGRTCTVA